MSYLRSSCKKSAVSLILLLQTYTNICICIYYYDFYIQIKQYSIYQKKESRQSKDLRILIYWSKRILSISGDLITGFYCIQISLFYRTAWRPYNRILLYIDLYSYNFVLPLLFHFVIELPSHQFVLSSCETNCSRFASFHFRAVDGFVALWHLDAFLQHTHTHIYTDLK